MHGPQSVCPHMTACVHLPIERKLLFPGGHLIPALALVSPSETL